MNPTDRNPFDRFAARALRGGVLGLKKVTGLFRKQAALPENPERILAVKPWGLGALILATPALAALRKRFPAAELTLLTQKNLDTLYDNAGLYDRVSAWDADELRALPHALRRFRAEAAELRYDLAVNLDGLGELACLLTHLSGAPATAGLVPGGERRGYTAPVELDETCHAAQACLDVAQAVGAEAEIVPPLPPKLKSAELEQARDTLRQWGVDSHSPLVGLNMNAGGFAPRRAWPAEKFVLLAEFVEELGGYKTVFFGSAEEERFVSRHVKHMHLQPINLAGRTSVRQLAALLAQLHLFVSCDSGPLHLASALGVPCVGIYGPESPRRSGIAEGEKAAVVWRKPECGPCVSFLRGELKPCQRGEECVREITLETVRRVVTDLLDHLADPENPPWLGE